MPRRGTHCSLRRRRGDPSRAFTLVEMLVVMGVIGILLGLVVPVATHILRGSNLTQSGQAVGDQLVLARQTALASNRRVQIRFYDLPVASASGANNFCGIQTFRVEDSGQATPLTKLQVLRSGVIFAADAPASTTRSTLLVPPGTAVVSVKGTDKLPAYGNQPCDYVGFQYLPDGSTDLDPTATTASGGWFITLVEGNKVVPSGQPINFYTVRVDPINGRVLSFRP